MIEDINTAIFCTNFEYYKVAVKNWYEVLSYIKQIGFSSICIKNLWSVHNPYNNIYNFCGNLNIRKLIRFCGRIGLIVIVQIDVPNVYNIPDWINDKKSNKKEFKSYLKLLAQAIDSSKIYKSNEILGIYIKSSNFDYYSTEQVKIMIIDAGIKPAYFWYDDLPAKISNDDKDTISNKNDNSFDISAYNLKNSNEFRCIIKKTLENDNKYDALSMYNISVNNIIELNNIESDLLSANRFMSKGNRFINIFDFYDICLLNRNCYHIDVDIKRKFEFEISKICKRLCIEKNLPSSIKKIEKANVIFSRPLHNGALIVCKCKSCAGAELINSENKTIKLEFASHGANIIVNGELSHYIYSFKNDINQNIALITINNSIYIIVTDCIIISLNEKIRFVSNKKTAYVTLFPPMKHHNLRYYNLRQSEIAKKTEDFVTYKLSFPCEKIKVKVLQISSNELAIKIDKYIVSKIYSDNLASDRQTDCNNSLKDAKIKFTCINLTADLYIGTELLYSITNDNTYVEISIEMTCQQLIEQNYTIKVISQSDLKEDTMKVEIYTEYQSDMYSPDYLPVKLV